MPAVLLSIMESWPHQPQDWIDEIRVNPFAADDVNHPVRPTRPDILFHNSIENS